MIRTALSYKAANSRGLKRKAKQQLPAFWLYKMKAQTARTLSEVVHPCFVPEVRKCLASKGLPFKVLLILNNAPATQSSISTPKALKWSTFPNTMSLTQPLDEGIKRTCNAHYTWYSMERTLNTMAENSTQENIMKVWKDHTIEDARVVTEKL